MVCSQLRDKVTELKSPIPCWYCQGENDKFLHLTVSPTTESVLSQTEEKHARLGPQEESVPPNNTRAPSLMSQTPRSGRETQQDLA